MSASSKHIRKLIISALLCTVSILLTRLMAGNFLVLGVPAGRLSLGFLPIMLAGILLGGGWGAAVGLLADLLGFFLFPNGVYFPPIALTSVFAGLAPGLIFTLTPKWGRLLRVGLSVAVVQLFGSLLMQTYWLSLLYGKGFWVLLPPRAAVALVLIPVYTALLCPLLSALKRAVPRLIDRKI